MFFDNENNNRTCTTSKPRAESKIKEQASNNSTLDLILIRHLTKINSKNMACLTASESRHVCERPHSKSMNGKASE